MIDEGRFMNDSQSILQHLLGENPMYLRPMQLHFISDGGLQFDILRLTLVNKNIYQSHACF